MQSEVLATVASRLFELCTDHALELHQLHYMQSNLTGNGSNMSARVTTTPTLSAKNRLMSIVADVMTGFVAGSRVGWCIST